MAHSLYSRFRNFIRENNLFKPEDKVLLTVSGGVDSVVLAHIFHRAEFRFSMAHCNFGLRAQESEGDEEFVRNLAAELGVEIFVKRFDTKYYASENKLSTQLAARELRYTWFGEIISENKYKYIATAHHQDDFTETVLLNLIKGSILQGLQGIPMRNENIIRPLLFAKKTEILDFAEQNNWKFREDSSNKEDKYQRNLIRNQVIPLMKNINPNLTETVYQSAQHRSYYSDFFLQEADNFVKEFVKQEAGKHQISISHLPEKYFNPIFFNHWLSAFGFTFQQSVELVSCINSTESKTFISSTHQVFKEREKIVLLLQTEEIEQIAYIDNPGNALVFRGKEFETEILSIEGIGELKDKNTAYFDLDSIQFPLILRSWQQGDYFIPFGFGKRKKLSDFYRDLKFSSTRKHEQVLLANKDGEIMWIVGLRTDDRFKITKTTKQVLRIAVK